MGTRAQIDVRKGKETVRIYFSPDGTPDNVLLALEYVVGRKYSTPSSIAQAIIRYFPSKHFDLRIADKYDDQSKYVNHHFVVSVSTKPWRVRHKEAAGVILPTKPDGSLDDSKKAFEDPKNFVPAVTRSFRIGRAVAA